MKTFKHRLEYGLVCVFDAFFSALPEPVAIWIGEQLGSLMSCLIYKRQRLILENLGHAFPEKKGSERERISKSVWRNLGRTAVEFIRLPDFISQERGGRVRWTGAEHMEKALADRTGVILLAAHFSNWELLGALHQNRFGHFTAVARPMKNPFVEAWVQSKRAATGMKIILHREAVKASLRWLKSKNIIGILVDQNLYTGGVFVDFFGRPAATTTLPALLHMRTGAPILITYLLREGEKYHAVIEPMSIPSNMKEDEQASVITQAISKKFEDIIRHYPENWFWIHNRWKRKV